MALDNDDKKWMSEQMTRVIGEVTADLGNRIGGKLDEIASDLARGFDQKLEAVETKLLAQLHDWAVPLDLKQSGHGDMLQALAVEVRQVKERLAKLEGKTQ